MDQIRKTYKGDPEYSRISKINSLIKEIKKLKDKPEPNFESNLVSVEGGILYDTLFDAQSVDPVPSDGTVFQVSRQTDPNNSGVYSFQSQEANGVRFERDFDFVTEYLEKFSYNEEYIFDREGFTEGFVRPGGSISTSSSYRKSDPLNCKFSTKLYITSRVASFSVSPAVFYDENDNFISGYTALNTELTTHVVNVPSNASYFITSLPLSQIDDNFKIEWDVEITYSFFANPVSSSLEKSYSVYLSPNGNDSNEGTKTSPFKTFNRALLKVLKGGEIILLEGDYQKLQIPDISGIKVKGEEQGKVRLINNRQSITNASLEAGYTKVYRTNELTSLHPNTINLWQHDIPDENTLIDISEKNEWHKNKTHRLPSTKIVPALSIQDIEDSTELKYFESGGYVYFSKVESSDLAVNFIAEPTNLMTDFVSCDLDLEDIEIFYTVFHYASGSFKLKFNRVSVFCTNSSNFYLGGDVKAELKYCNTGGSGNDGVGIKGNADVIEDCLWSHDNDDEGSSAHDTSKVFRKNCFFEYNASSDIADVNSCSSTSINCLSKSTASFVFSFQEVGGNNYGTGTMINCICYGSIGGTIGRVKAYNTLLIGSTISSSVEDFNTVQVSQ